jgi:pyruvate kinase
LKRAKIVCTIGPACSDERILRGLIDAGMNVARLNFSHGSHDDHRENYERIRRISDKVAIMQDLQGPKIRVGEIKGGKVFLGNGDEIILTTEEGKSEEGKISVTYDNFPKDVHAGDSIFMSDGTIHLEAIESMGTEVRCRVINGGVLASRKGINLPGVNISSPALTEKDREDLKFGMELGVDFVALSFVRRPDEVMEVKRIIRQSNSMAGVVAKIEKREAIDNFDEILDVSDGIMIARGDLGVEIPTEEVPVIQKRLIKKCLKKGKPVITATQMLESMTHVERPTRAEASDVANAILDGTDAVMLSEETATGRFPIQAVTVMRNIIVEMEKGAEYPYYLTEDMEKNTFNDIDGATDAICLGATDVARKIDASAIAVLSHTGKTARMIIKRRPSIPVLVLTDFLPVVRQMALSWGVETILVKRIETTEKIFAISRQKVKEAGYRGRIVLTAGIPTKEIKPSNTVHVFNI